MHECCRFLNHLLAGCIWSCASFCWCSFQSVFFFHRISVDPLPPQYGCYCVHMHQHQQWFTVKEFSVWNNDDDTRIIFGREVKFMFGNAFLQSHCLWTYICMVTNVSEPAHSHAYSIFPRLFRHDAFCIKQDRWLACRSHHIWVFMNFIWK